VFGGGLARIGFVWRRRVVVVVVVVVVVGGLLEVEEVVEEVFGGEAGVGLLVGVVLAELAEFLEQAGDGLLVAVLVAVEGFEPLALVGVGEGQGKAEAGVEGGEAGGGRVIVVRRVVVRRVVVLAVRPRMRVRGCDGVVVVVVPVGGVVVGLVAEAGELAGGVLLAAVVGGGAGDDAGVERLEVGGLGGGAAAEFPSGVDELFDEGEFEDVAGHELAEGGEAEVVEEGEVLVGEEAEVGEDAVLDGVEAGEGFAPGRARPGGLAGVEAVGFELLERWHGGSPFPPVWRNAKSPRACPGLVMALVGG
jgi:hypothetical protein